MSWSAQASPSRPHLRFPTLAARANWRLTMYGAFCKPETKDFMRNPISLADDKSFSGFTGAGDPPQNVSTMRPPPCSDVVPVPGLAAERSSDCNKLRRKSSAFDTRADEMADA